jgi:hypothetical protein
MAISKRYRKHPHEIIPVVFPFTKFLDENADTYASHDVFYDDGVYLVSSTNVGGDIHSKVGAGRDGHSYLLACELVTAAGLKKRVEVQIRVRGREAAEGVPIDGGSPTVNDTGTPVIDGGVPL